MLVSKKELELVHDIQVLAMQIKDVFVYYQQNIQLFQVYRIIDHKHTFNESVYLDIETASDKLEKIKYNLTKIKEREEHYGQFCKEN